MKSTEIAKLAGVSRSTVSRVINGYSNVPPETRRRVMDVVEKYGYSPNNAARNLAGKPSRIVGLFIVDLDETSENIIHASPFYSAFLTYAADRLQQKGYQLLVSVIKNRMQMKNILNMFQENMVSGGIFMGDLVPSSILKALSDAHCTSILINQRESVNYPGILTANTENYWGAYEAVNTLIENGHKRIAHIAGSIDKSSTRERFEGYRDCLLKNGIPFEENLVVKMNIHREENGYWAAKQIFANNQGRLPTAIFSSNDLLALGAMRALGDMGFRIPQDVSIIGFDNTEISRFTTPPLSTVAASVEKLSNLAIDNLVALVEGKECLRQNLKLEEFEVIVRESILNINAPETPTDI
ncbi:LacI family DNA-binding transcriptional regulator [Anaerotruncus rubiinfantis]|jgi:LacI family transcriptional regulator|uniref:LacI family DNA-binding transcriptional regulator n=1 Tax=Anaerotruncus rubiinfantis TaxID=1720200 RepID=UPI000835B54D|nr:LacI family DNA-binding transcriptional regulator [Anaerotruncus rubiinfantis]